MENDKILKELSTNLALYFKLGDISNYNKFTEIIESNFQFRDKESEWVTDELNKKPQSPIELMYNRYKQRKLTDFKRDIKFCQSVILDIYELKKIQMKNKTEICVYIRNEEELQQAKDILLNNRHHICKSNFSLYSNKDWNFLFYSRGLMEWCISFIDRETEIPLSELESFLKGESVENQSSIEWMFNEIKRRQEIIFSEPDGITRETMIDCLSNGLIEQAKQMHREEIEHAVKFGQENSHPASTEFNEVKAKNYYTIKYTMK